MKMKIDEIIIYSLTVVYIVFTLFYLRKLRFDVKKAAAAGMMVAATVVLNIIRIPLPTGATMGLVSVLPIMLISLIYDARLGIVTGLISAVVLPLLVPAWVPIHPMQFFVEHIVSLSCLGYAGIFGTKNRGKMLAACFIALFIKVLSHFASGIIFFSQNAPDGWGAYFYSFVYNLSSVGVEGVLSIIVIMLLPFERIKKVVLREGK